jgi:hypothetical protein
MKTRCAVEAKRRNDFHVSLAMKVGECSDDANRVISLFQQMVNSSIERITNRQLIFKKKIKQEENDQKQRFGRCREELLAVDQQRLKMLDDVIGA